jgi:serine protease Do
MRIPLSALVLAGTLLAVTAPAQQNSEQFGWRAARVVQILPQTRTENPGYMGVRFVDLDADHARSLKLTDDHGAEIKAVMEGSPADRAGIRPGDVLLSYNGEPILGARQLSRLVQETPPGKRVKVQFWRDGKEKTTTLTLGAAPVSTPDSFPGFSLPNWQNPLIDIPRPFLVWDNAAVGIEFERVDSQLADYFGVKGGVLVRAVQQGSPADKAGVRAGDVIFSVAQQVLSSEHDFASFLRQRGTVPLSLMRNHKRLDLTISLPQ